jgi:sialic acid synthase SpsE
LPGTIGCEIATALGAEVIEKHIRLDESKGQDNLCALTGKEFRIMCKKLNRIKTLMGSGRRHYSAEEKENESWALKKNGKRPYLS